MADKYPELESKAEAPSEEGGPNFVKSSKSVGYGHEDSMNRLPDPNAEWVNEESGEGKG